MTNFDILENKSVFLNRRILAAKPVLSKYSTYKVRVLIRDQDLRCNDCGQPIKHKVNELKLEDLTYSYWSYIIKDIVTVKDELVIYVESCAIKCYCSDCLQHIHYTVEQPEFIKIDKENAV